MNNPKPIEAKSKMKTRLKIRLRAFLMLGLAFAAAGAQAQHINAGALSTIQGGQLYFDNAQGFLDASGFIITNQFNMTFAASGTYAGYYQIGDPTFTALAQTTANGATPSPHAASFGSFLELSILGVNGPAGGVFSFWDHNATTPTYSFNMGDTATTDLFELSDPTLGAGAPGADPFGHIHGRRWTATIPGTYTVGVQIFDTSVNGLNNGPIQAPSGIYYVTFTAVPEPSVMALAGLGSAGLLLVARDRRRSP